MQNITTIVATPSFLIIVTKMKVLLSPFVNHGVMAIHLVRSKNIPKN